MYSIGDLKDCPFKLGRQYEITKLRFLDNIIKERDIAHVC